MNTDILFLCLILLIFIYGFIKKVNCYSIFIKGVKEGLNMFIHIYPSLLAMNFAIYSFKESNLLLLLCSLFTSIFSFIPKEVLPLIIFRPLSANASLSLLIDIYKKVGVDSLAGLIGSVVQSSSDTTFFVIFLYFSHVKIKNTKNVLFLCLFSDFCGIIMAIVLSLFFF